MNKKKNVKDISVEDVLNDLREASNRAMADFYDRKLMQLASAPSFLGPKIIGWKKVKEARWFTIKVPAIDWSYEEIEDYGEYSTYKGILISFKDVRLFKIGYKLVDEPIYEKKTKKVNVIKFRRYGSLKSGIKKSKTKLAKK